MPTVTPRRTTRIIFNTVEGGVLNLPARVEGGRVTRTLGLGGDELVVLVRASDWPLPNGPTTGGGVDFKQPCTLRFGNFDGPEPLIDLEHYYVRQIDPMMVTAADVDEVSGNGLGANVVARLVRIRFVTLPAYIRGDGRGGRIREKTYNKLLSGGGVDTGDASYLPNSSLVDICLSALGLTYEVSPISLDDVPPPGALDWGNRPPLHELESVLERAGHSIALPNSGTALRIVELPKFADSIVLDSDVTAALSKPLIVAKAPSLRGDVIVVTSGDTRTTVLTTRDLSAMEWVFYYEPGRTWLNDIETEALTPPLDDITPDSIEAFKAGPDPTDKDKAARYGRVFKALRLTGDDEGLRLVQAWEPMTFERVAPDTGTFTLGSMSAWARGRASIDTGNGTLVSNVASGSAVNDLGPVEVHAEAGVFVLPSKFVYVVGNADVDEPFARNQTTAMTGADLQIYFAHEARFTEAEVEGFSMAPEGAFSLNYFVAAFRVTRVADVLTLTLLTGEDLVAAYEDPTSVFLDAPELRRVVRFYPGDTNPEEINRSELEDRAEEIARMKASLALAEGGVAECVGWLNKAPGCCSGSCSSVTWDLENYTTTLVLNDHETPGGVLDQRALLAKRSFAAGVMGWNLPGGAAARSEVKTRSTPGISTTPTGIAAGGGSGGGGGSSGGMKGNDAERASATRGVPTTPARPSGELPGGDMAPPPFEPFLAKITVATGLAGNRWGYQFNQAVPVIFGADAGKFTTVTGGFSSATHGTAYNLAEASNDGSGVEGNGVNVSNLPAGWSIQPIPVGAVVLIEMCIADSAGHKACFFYRENTVDGACPSSGGAGGGGTESRPSSDGVLAALDMVLTDAAGNVLLDAVGGVLLNADSVSLSLSDLRAFDHWLTDTSGAGRVFVVDAGGRILIGDSASEVSPASEQLIDRVLTDAAGQPLTDDAGNLLASV